MQRRTVIVGLAALVASVTEISPTTVLGATLDRNGINTVRIFAYRISLEQADDREKLGLVAQELRLRAEKAERRWRMAREALRVARARNVQSGVQVARLEQTAAQREADFAQIIEELTEQLAAQDRDYKRDLANAITVGTKLLESDEGRRAIELIALGGEKNISAGLDTLDAAAAIADKMDNLRKAERYRQRARVNLGVQGIGSATTGKIIGLFETVVASDPSSFADWLELARLYRDANRLQDAVKAADNAEKYAANDGERAIAIIERADTYFLQLKNEDMILSFRRAAAEFSAVIGLGRDKLAALPAEKKFTLILEMIHKFVDDIAPLLLQNSTIAIDDYKKADAILDSTNTQMNTADLLRWRATSSLRLFSIYKINLKSIVTKGLQKIMKEGLPPKNVIISEKELSTLLKKMNFKSVLEQNQSSILSNFFLLYNQTIDANKKIVLLGESDKSISVKLEVIIDYTQLIGSADVMKFLTSNGKSNSNDFIERIIDESIESILSINPDLILAKRVKANYLFASGVARISTDEKTAITRLTESKAIFDELAVRDPTSSTPRRASAKVLWRLANIATSGTKVEDALAAYKKLKADGMLAPIDEPELAIIEESISLGMPFPSFDF